MLVDKLILGRKLKVLSEYLDFIDVKMEENDKLILFGKFIVR